jgi:hypothetical protein
MPLIFGPDHKATSAAVLGTETDFFKLTATETGRLTARVHAAGFNTRLSLYDPNGSLLVESDGQSLTDKDDLIVQYLTGAPEGRTYYLSVGGLAGGMGVYTLTAELDPADSPFPPPASVADHRSVVSGFFSRDGRLDLVTADADSGNVAILLGQGDGSFQGARLVANVLHPTALVAGDFNGDGRADLAVVHQDASAPNDHPAWVVSIYLGIGDGTFRALPASYAVGDSASAIVAGDFDGDGHLDLAVANAGSNDVSILLGNGDGTFRAGPRRFAVGERPSALVAGDFDGDHRLDLAVANAGSNDVSILRGKGDGTFTAAGRYAVKSAPSAILAGHFRGDKAPLDLAVANHDGNPDGSNDGSVSVLLGNGDGTFQDQVEYVVGSGPVALVTGDFNGDGVPDLVAADGGDNDVHVLQGNGDGTFQNVLSATLPGESSALVTGDFDGDGTTDLAATAGAPGKATVRLDRRLPGNNFYLADPIAGTNVRSVPLVADLNGDGIPDSVIVSQSGQILVRLGRADQPGTFAPPSVVNPDRPARAVAVVKAGAHYLLAAIDLLQDSLSVYALDPSGQWTFRESLAIEVGSLPTRIVAANLSGPSDGFQDLAVLNSLSGRVSVYFSDGKGGFGDTHTTDVGGNGRSDLTVANGKGRADDLVVTNQASGDVTVLVNNGEGSNFTEERFRAGAGPFAVADDGTTMLAGDKPGAAVAADVNGDGNLDLVAPDAGANALAILLGQGDESFLNPILLPLGFSPTAVAAGHFRGANKPLDLAVLNSADGTISIFLGDGAGGFKEFVQRDSSGQKIPLLAGVTATTLSVADINGQIDLFVGDPAGDVLVLQGDGNGTFHSVRPAGHTVALAVADLNGDGKTDFILASQDLDRVTVQYPQPGHSFSRGRSDGLLAPGAIKVADLDGDGIPDLIVANGGGDEVLAYAGLGNGQFGPARRFFTGTDPEGITVADLNGDGIPDLIVANKGSNDVAILFGQGRGTDWTLTAGPRLQAGTGPVSTTLAQLPGQPFPDLLVTNSGSNNVFMLRGVGNGFFNDQDPRVFNTGLNPRQAMVGNFDGSGDPSLITVNAGSNNLSFFPQFGAGLAIASGGSGPVAAVDFKDNGLTDLIVANEDDGHFALFLGQAGGLVLSQAQSLPNLHPTDLALSGVMDNEVGFYATTEGSESVRFLTFVLNQGVPIPASFPGTNGGGQRLQVADLLPLENAVVSVVATLVTASGNRIVEEEGNTGPIVAVLPLSAPLNSGVATEEEAPRSDTDAALTIGADQNSLYQFLSGFEDACDRARQDARQRLRGSKTPPGPGGQERNPIDPSFDKSLREWGEGGMGHWHALPTHGQSEEANPKSEKSAADCFFGFRISNFEFAAGARTDTFQATGTGRSQKEGPEGFGEKTRLLLKHAAVTLLAVGLFPFGFFQRCSAAPTVGDSERLPARHRQAGAALS